MNQQVISLAAAGVAALSALTAVCALFVAKRQSRISAEKLRFDLYGRRFEVYSRTIDFYQALLTWDGSELAKGRQAAFIKVFRESRFMFDNRSGVYEILDQMNGRSMKVIGLKEHGKELTGCEDVYLKMYGESQSALEWFPTAIAQLEQCISPYLDFHKISA